MAAMEIGVVVIGRNEGGRLGRSLKSAAKLKPRIVYVDSGSSDGSVQRARALGAHVLELNPGIPFTAARARNEGFDCLLERHPEVEVVQFVDGDCEMVAGWTKRGMAELRDHRDYGIVAGHTIERSPNATIYNRLCSLEWQKSPGEIRACGGIFMIRAAVYREAGGMDPEIIAAEDDELCLRVRRLGYRIVQIDQDMVIHDVAMTRFSQWWRRAVRTGYAFAQGAHLHGRGTERHFVKEVQSTCLWGLVVPAAAVGLAWISFGLSLLFLLGPLALASKVYRYGRSRLWAPADALLYAASCVGGKFPTAIGILRFQFDRIRGRRGSIIEYKRQHEH